MIIVTGANGFIGSAIVWELNQAGISNIIAVDSIGLEQRPELLKKRQFQKFLLKDEIWGYLNSAITDATKSSADTNPGSNPGTNANTNKPSNWIIHMGACSSTTETNWPFLKENNTEYTQRLFSWCQEHQWGFIYASSAATYGNGELGFDDSTDPEQLKPLNLYGESKVLADRWILKQSQTPKNWYGLKFFNVFGPNEYLKESMSSVAFKAFHQISKTNRLGLFKSYVPEYKDGEQKRDFVYVKDVTRWIKELIELQPPSGIYNMGFGKARTWVDLANAVFAGMEKTPQIDWLEMPENIRNQYQYFTEAKMSNWKNQKMSDPQWPLEKAVKDYVQNYLVQKDPWL